MVDGYDPKTGTIYQFYGCKWHGCPCLGSNDGKYQKALSLENRIKSLGYDVVSVWKCENPELSSKSYPREFVPYPHYIVYDFEAVLRKRNFHQTSDVMIDCSHLPFSIAINNSLTKEPVFIENHDTEQLIKEFVEELTHRQELISREVWKKYLRIDDSSLPKQVQERWINWINQVPILRFNSRKYDLNLVKEHFVKTLSNMNDVTPTKKDKSYMFLTTPSFKFLDAKNYLAPGLSYSSWCKANGCEVQKLIFPYEWLDDYDKLSHMGPVTVEYENFYSKPEGGLTITIEEYAEFVRESNSRGCVTMMDWLRVYNEADIISFIEAVDKARNSYYPDEINMLKGAVSIPGISMTYVLNKVLKIKKLGDLAQPCTHKCNEACSGIGCKDCI